jgi:outer membrane protein
VKSLLSPAAGLLAVALALASVSSGGAQPAAKASPAPSASPSPNPLASVAPDVQELLTGPAALPIPSTIPYPAYGSPVPGINEGVPVAGIPTKLRLNEAVAIGIATSPSLAAARADAQLAKVNVDIAREGILPNLYGSGSFYRYYQNGSSLRTGGETGGGSVLQTGPYAYTQNGATVNLQQLIFDGGKVAAQIQAASRSQVAAVDTYRRQIQTVAYNVATAYLNVLAARRTTYVDVELVRQNQVQEDLVRAQYRAGTAARVDVATAELPTARARLAVVQAQAQELIQRANLANAMGLDANTLVSPVDDPNLLETSQLPAGITISYDRAMARALLVRPDYDAAVQTVQSNQKALLAARLGYSPTFMGVGSFGTTSTSQQGSDYRPSGQLGINLNLPIFNQGITRANVEQAKANLDVAQANLTTTTQSIQLAVKQALVAVVSARAGVDLANVEFRESVDVLNSTRAQYRAGVTTLPLLLNAQVQLTQALTDQTTALYTLREAEQQLLYAVGEILH